MLYLDLPKEHSPHTETVLKATGALEPVSYSIAENPFVPDLKE